MLEETDLRKISEELLKFNSDIYSYSDAIDLIFNAIEKGIRRFSEPSASDIYVELIISIIYGGENNE